MSRLISSCCHQPIRIEERGTTTCSHCCMECDILDTSDPDNLTESELAEIKADQKDEAQHRRDYENNLLPKY